MKKKNLLWSLGDLSTRLYNLQIALKKLDTVDTVVKDRLEESYKDIEHILDILKDEDVEEDPKQKSIVTDNYDAVRFNETMQLMLAALGGNSYRDKAPVMIYGKLVYLNSTEIAALQVLAKRFGREKWRDPYYTDFSENVHIYSGRTPEESKRILKLGTEGGFRCVSTDEPLSAEEAFEDRFGTHDTIIKFQLLWN